MRHLLQVALGMLLLPSLVSADASLPVQKRAPLPGGFGSSGTTDTVAASAEWPAACRARLESAVRVAAARDALFVGARVEADRGLSLRIVGATRAVTVGVMTLPSDIEAGGADRWVLDFDAEGTDGKRVHQQHRYHRRGWAYLRTFGVARSTVDALKAAFVPALEACLAMERIP